MRRNSLISGADQSANGNPHNGSSSSMMGAQTATASTSTALIGSAWRYPSPTNAIARPNGLPDHRSQFALPAKPPAWGGAAMASRTGAAAPEGNEIWPALPRKPSIGPASSVAVAPPVSILPSTPGAPVRTSEVPRSPSNGEPTGENLPLDRYAKTFVPKWLKDVNTDQNFTYEALPDSEAGGPLDYDKYALNAWPLPLWEALKAGQLTVGEEGQITGNADAWLPEDSNGQGDSLEAEGQETTDGDSSMPMKSETSQSSMLSVSDDEADHARKENTKRIVIPGLPTLTSKSYNLHWTPLLEEEAKHRMEELSSCTLYAQLITRYPQGSSETNGLYTVAVPGIREERPRLFPGDRLHLRPLATPSPYNTAQNAGWLHVVFEARIRAVRTLHGELAIECPQIESWIQRGLLKLYVTKFNITFAYNRSALDDSSSAVNVLGQKLYQTSSASSQVLRKWLFSTLDDAQEEVQRVSAQTSLSTWHDDGLNPEQKAAVTSIAIHDRRIPFLLSGPPGTGKTKTCVEAVLQILRGNKKAKVLLVAPSNAASDVLALRLAKHLPPKEMYRINHSTRTFAEVPEALSPYTYVDQEKSVFSLPPWSDFMRARVVVTACHDVSMLNRCRVANNLDLGELQKRLLPGLCQDPDAPITLHWTHLLVDEAGQATEPDLAPALSCVLPHPMCRDVPSIVLVGDVKQLGPAIRSDLCRTHELDVSLLERLSRRPAYTASLAALYKLGRDIVTSRGQGRAPVSADFVNCGHLLRNYRARHPALLHLPSNLFYGDSLVPSSVPTSRSIGLLSWRGLPKRGVTSGQPLLFVDNDTPEEWVDEGVSWWNAGEANEIVQICQDLLKHNQPLAQEEISVISPFREQVWKVRIMLRRVDLGGVRVGPVEAFQGQESPVVIVSPVRSRKRFIQRDRETSSGLIFESKRLNVAITRARELLIVVGNAEALGVCEEWRQIIGHATRNGWMRRGKDREGAGSKVDDIDTQRVSALEYAERTGNGWWDVMLAQAGLRASSDEGQNGTGPGAARVDQDEATSLLAGRMATVAMLADDNDD